MVFIYGRKSTQLAMEHLPEACAHCGASNSINMFVFQRYGHLFWIPFFPMGKTGISICSHCKQTKKLNEMPANLRSAFERVAKTTKTPIWTFTLLIIMGLSFGTSLVSVVYSKIHAAGQNTSQPAATK